MSEWIQGKVPEERAAEWQLTQVRDYLAEISMLCSVLEKAKGPTREELDRRHVGLAKGLLESIMAESGNAVEQAVLTAMCGLTMLSTFDGQMDWMEFQIGLMGEGDAR